MDEAPARAGSADGALLRIRGLQVSYPGRAGEVVAVDDVALDVQPGEIVALVGESGSGKTACCLAIPGLLDRRARVNGSIRFDGVELLGDRRAQASVRGYGVAMIFQESTGSLNPVRSIGSQLDETTGAHEASVGALRDVSVPGAPQRLRQYPHELSGGTNQRIMIGMMLTRQPRLLIADEPTSALDTTTQAQILALLARLRRERGMAILLVTHDLGVASAISDRVAVMRHGRLVEAGCTAQVLSRPVHPYTKALLHDRLEVRSGPVRPARQATSPLIKLTGVGKSYLVGPHGKRFAALQDIGFEIGAGEAFGLIGESGSGKSTLARLASGIEAPDSGVIAYGAGIDAGHRASLHRAVQYVFQDPLGALDRRLRVIEQLCEPLEIHGLGTRSGRRQQALAMLRQVELDGEIAIRLPHELSGGQRQRVVLARALMLQPRLLVCDEPVGALDAATQAQIFRLLQRLQNQLGLSLLLVSHDLAHVRHLCDRMAVLYYGRIVESGTCAQVLGRPAHPYTKALVAAALQLGMPTAQMVSTEPPSRLDPPPGCAFHRSCPEALPQCRVERPAVRQAPGGQLVACHAVA